MRPREIAAHYLKHKDADFVRAEADKYDNQEQVMAWVKIYINRARGK